MQELQAELSLEQRNEEILRMWREEHLTYQAIGNIVGLSKVQVGHILKQQVQITKRLKDWEKEKRIVLLERELDKKEDEVSKKDKVEIIEQLRKEFESEEKNPVVNFNKIEIIVEYENSPKTERKDNTDDCIDVEASSMLPQ